MADNVTIPATGTGTATPVIKTDDVGGVQYQQVKLDGGGNGLSVPIVAGQQTSAASLPVVISSDQSAIPVTATFTPSGTQNVDPVANTIGLATGAKQDTGNTALSTINTTLGSPFQAGGSIGNTAFTANAGTNLNTSSLALESSLSSLNGKVTAVNTGAVVVASGSITAVQPTGTNLHVVVDSGTVTATVASTTVTGNVTVVQGTGTNLHTVIDSGTTTVTQATGTNLHTVVDSGTITTVSTVTSATVVQPTGTNLHAVIDTGSTTAVTQATASNLKAQVTGAGTAGSADTGVQTVQGIASMTPLLVTATVTSTAITATVTSVNDLNTNQTLLSSLATRKGYKLFNDSTVTAYVKEGTTATTTDYSYQILAQGYYESVGVGCYTGQIDCIWASNASGAMKITELA